MTIQELIKHIESFPDAEEDNTKTVYNSDEPVAVEINMQDPADCTKEELIYILRCLESVKLHVQSYLVLKD